MKCPYCAADYQLGEVKCSYCRSALPQPAQPVAQAQQPIQIINYNYAPPVYAHPAAVPYPAYQPVQPMVSRPAVSPRNRAIALLLCVFGGYLGIHQFYAGRVLRGIVYFLTGGLFLFGWAIDTLKLLFGTFRDGEGLPLRW